MNLKDHEQFLEFIFGTDMDFYNKYLADMSEEEFQKFLEENPDFMME